MKKKKINLSNLLLDIVIYAIMIFCVIITVYPVWYVIVASFATTSEVQLSGGILFWPENLVTGAYELVFSDKRIYNGFIVSLEVLVLALPLNIILTLIVGYFMATTGMMFKKPLVWMMLFTMYFGGGLVPSYLNIKSLGMMDTIWCLVIPGAVSVYNSIICKTAIESLPESLKESAYLDGASHMQVILKIVLPLIKPTLAVLLLYYGVAHWNSWFAASIYIRDPYKLPIQNIIRDFLLANSTLAAGVASGDNFDLYAETIKYAAIVICTFPIMCIYPFLQKYFAKGVMIGAVKG